MKPGSNPLFSAGGHFSVSDSFSVAAPLPVPDEEDSFIGGPPTPIGQTPALQPPIPPSGMFQTPMSFFSTPAPQTVTPYHTPAQQRKTPFHTPASPQSVSLNCPTTPASPPPTLITALEVKRDELSQEMTELREAIDGQTETLKQATDMRKEEKEENEATLDKAKKGLKALNEAILILKSFYKEAAKATALLQVSPIDAATGGAATPGFEGSSSGNQAGSKAIIGLLEVIRSDFERTVRTVDAAEKKAHADFVEMDRELRADTAGKETKEELDKQDHTTTLASIEAKTADMQTNMDLVDNANAELEELKPVCIDTGMSYEERVQKREEEINALHNALCILDTDNVEADCTQQ